MVADEVVVVDTSLAVKWIVNEHDSDQADELARRWASNGVRLVAPSVLAAELTNAIHRRINDEDLTLEEGASAVEDLLNFELTLLDSAHLMRRTLELANRLGQGAVYDSHYLALAESLDCEFWTADSKFYQAAHGFSDNLRLLSDFDPIA